MSRKPIRRAMSRHNLKDLVDHQTDLPQLLLPYRTEARQGEHIARSNEEAWGAVLSEEFYDTTALRLEGFHLLEWFPLAPGTFHTAEGREHRERAAASLWQTEDGTPFYDPGGKADMLLGGIGSVRLLPKRIGGEVGYFMSASSSGVCHEGFPIFLPRKQYGRLRPLIREYGAAAVTVSGVLRFLPRGLQSFSGSRRQIPALYLHVDYVRPPRVDPSRTSELSVSVAVSFESDFDGYPDTYVTYTTFHPADRYGVTSACTWIREFYVGRQYPGIVVTDFDEVREHFPGAVFKLRQIMGGKLGYRDREEVNSDMWVADPSQGFRVWYGNIDFREAVVGSVNVLGNGGIRAGRDFIGGSRVTHGNETQGDNIETGNITGSGIAIGRQAHATAHGTVTSSALQIDPKELSDALKALRAALGEADLRDDTLIAAQTAAGLALIEGVKNGDVKPHALLENVEKVAGTLKQANVAVQEGTSLWKSVQTLAPLVGPLVGGAHVVAAWFGVQL